MARNKKHKQRHSSKREVSRRAQGKVVTEKAPGAVKKTSLRGGDVVGAKDAKRQALNARRATKNVASAKEKSIGSKTGPPRILGLMPANESGNVPLLFDTLCKATDGEARTIGVPVTVATKLSKQRFTLVSDPDGDEQRSIDVGKVSDICLLALDVSAAVQETLKDIRAEHERPDMDDDDFEVGSTTTWFADVGLCITDMTRELVQHLNSQGAPTIVVVLQGLQSYDNTKRRRQAIKLHERYFASVLAKEHRVLPADTEEDMTVVLRTLSSIKLRSLKWREQRPYLVVDSGIYDEETQELKLSGFLRGANAHASQLFHVTNHGTYQVKNIMAPGDPCPVRSTANDVCGVLDEPHEDTQESLEECQVNVDTLMDEGFPTEADVEHAMQLPPGTSEYQAAWYDGDEAPPAVELSAPVAAPIEEDRVSRRTAQTDVEFLKSADILRHDKLTDEERRAELDQLYEDCEDEERHPDEMEVPFEIPGRHRFQKYRGMKSFTTGAWNPRENLPEEYARIFKLQGYSQIRDVSLFEAAQGPVEVGTYVCVTLKDVPKRLWESADHVMILSGQLRHEQKWSVLHFHIQRNTEFDEPIKSKTPMLAHVGFRKFYCAPLFSDATVGDRSKFARYFLPGEKFRIATFFGPVSYHPCPILLFKAPTVRDAAERTPLPLCCFGSAMAPNPDFLLLKRIVLTGRIAMIHKKQVVVKFMFFNEDDVKWFQPVDLYTRLGRQGKIIKAVGTHGLFKAQFNDTVMQHDMVCMALYKRVFPKWKTVMYDVADDCAAAAEVDVDED